MTEKTIATVKKYPSHIIKAILVSDELFEKCQICECLTTYVRSFDSMEIVYTLACKKFVEDDGECPNYVLVDPFKDFRG